MVTFPWKLTSETPAIMSVIEYAPYVDAAGKLEQLRRQLAEADTELRELLSVPIRPAAGAGMAESLSGSGMGQFAVNMGASRLPVSSDQIEAGVAHLLASDDADSLDAIPVDPDEIQRKIRRVTYRQKVLKQAIDRQSHVVHCTFNEALALIQPEAERQHQEIVARLADALLEVAALAQQAGELAGHGQQLEHERAISRMISVILNAVTNGIGAERAIQPDERERHAEAITRLFMALMEAGICHFEEAALRQAYTFTSPVYGTEYTAIPNLAFGVSGSGNYHDRLSTWLYGAREHGYKVPDPPTTPWIAVGEG